MTRKRKLEDYMKTIYQLRKEGEVRSIDLVRVFDVKKSTVSVSVRALEDEGYLIKRDDHTIELTEKGVEVAEETIQIYELLYGLLVDMGVPVELAAEDAHRMEHAVGKETSRYLEKVRGVEGVEVATPQFFLASASAGCCSVAVQIIGFDPDTDFSIQPWIRESWGMAISSSAVGSIFPEAARSSSIIPPVGWWLNWIRPAPGWTAPCMPT